MLVSTGMLNSPINSRDKTQASQYNTQLHNQTRRITHDSLGMYLLQLSAFKG